MAEDVVAGRYAIEGELGRGASATVFRARDTLLQRPVALKVISETLAADPEFKWRFEQEALLAAKLDHPHIVTVHDVGTLPGGRGFIAMRLLEGPSLDELLANRGKLPPAEAVDLAGQLAGALDYTHAAGLVHRDVKPSNVKVDASGWATLTDFGIARALDSARVTLPGLTIGTPRYMSPEQVRGEDTTPATDIYSLGVMVYEMLAGRPPFEGDGTALMYKIVHETPPPPAQFNPDLPQGVTDVIATALAKEPSDRWPSAGVFAAKLGEAFSVSTSQAGGLPAHAAQTRIAIQSQPGTTLVAAASLPVPPAQPPVAPAPLAETGPMPPPPPRRRSRRTAAAVLGGFAVLALAGGAAVFAISGDDDSRAGDNRTQSDDDRTQSHESDDDATATARAKAAQRRETQTASASTPEPARTSGLSQILPKTPEPTATSAPVATPTRAAVAPTSVVVQQPAATATPLQPTATPTVAPEPAFPTLVNFALCHSAPGCPGGVEDLYAGFPIYVVFQLSPPTLLSVEMDVYFDEVFEYTSPFSGSSSGAYVDTVPYAEHPGYLELEIYAGDEWVDTIWADVN